jgi:hypothetical protein
MSYQTQAAGPYPVNCLLQAFTLALAFAGTAVIDGVLPAPLLICRLTSLLVFAIDPAVDGLLLPCFLNRVL